MLIYSAVKRSLELLSRAGIFIQYILREQLIAAYCCICEHSREIHQINISALKRIHQQQFHCRTGEHSRMNTSDKYSCYEPRQLYYCTGSAKFMAT